MFKQKTKVCISLCLCMISILALCPLIASAQTVNKSDFTVQAVIPNNQIDEDKSYFDLLMNPGDTQTIDVEVTNNSKEEIILDIDIRAASTNRNGLIEYQVSVDPDETLKYPFDTIAEADNEITVSPESTETVNVTITMPDKEFDGAILGGLIFTKREKDTEETEGVSINNRFSYVVGVKLSETDTEIFPDFRLKSIEPTLINYRKAVAVNIHNSVALIIKNTNITASIFKKNETTPIFSVNKNGVDMAPNSVFPLPIEWEGNDLEAGDYTVQLKLTHEGKIWEWEEDFVIDADAANDINNNALDKEMTQNWFLNWWWAFAIGLVILLLLLWIAFLLGSRKRDKEEKYHK